MPTSAEQHSWPDDPPLSYAERSYQHWLELPVQRKARILLYLTRRLWRLVRGKAPIVLEDLGKALVFETIHRCRHARLVACSAWREVRSLIQLLRQDPAAIREFVDSIAGVGVTALMVIALMMVFPGAPDAMERRREHMVEAVRLARAYAPPPCVSDGDGGIWIDVGSDYVRPRDANYSALRRQLCGF